MQLLFHCFLTELNEPGTFCFTLTARPQATKQASTLSRSKIKKCQQRLTNIRGGLLPRIILCYKSYLFSIKAG